jgi:hydroxymethylpyrimidine/phosphomethylpyrimidine kinase
MLNDAATVHVVADAIRRHDLAPLVADPVMVATSGDV